MSCTFIAQIKEVCHYNSKFINLQYLNTEAHIDAILSPQGKTVANHTEGLDINIEPLTIFPAGSQEDISGQLDIQRPNNTGDVSFSWAWPQSGGHPIITNWTESTNSTDDLHGCTRRGWNRKEPPVCSQAYPKVERVSTTAFSLLLDDTAPSDRCSVDTLSTGCNTVIILELRQLTNQH